MTTLRGLKTERGGHRKFGTKTSAMWISDKAEAEEIDHKYGLKGRGDVFVVEDEKYGYALNGEQWDMKFDERGGQLKTVHHYTFAGVDTSQFKVWVVKRGRLARVTKAQAESKGYKIVADTKRRPDISQVRNAIGGQEPEVHNGTNT